jgi:hypothetical protein
MENPERASYRHYIQRAEESASKSKFKKSEPNTDKNDYIFSDSVDYFLVSPISKK